MKENSFYQYCNCNGGALVFRSRESGSASLSINRESTVKDFSFSPDKSGAESVIKLANEMIRWANWVRFNQDFIRDDE